MATSTKYGEIDIEGIPDDEPVFILRGQDSAAISAIIDYAATCKLMGSPQEHIEVTLDSIRGFAAWQVHDVKTPD